MGSQRTREAMTCLETEVCEINRLCGNAGKKTLQQRPQTLFRGKRFIFLLNNHNKLKIHKLREADSLCNRPLKKEIPLGGKETLGLRKAGFNPVLKHKQ